MALTEAGESGTLDHLCPCSLSSCWNGTLKVKILRVVVLRLCKSETVQSTRAVERVLVTKNCGQFCPLLQTKHDGSTTDSDDADAYCGWSVVNIEILRKYHFSRST